MEERVRIKAILDAIDILMNARNALFTDMGFWAMMFRLQKQIKLSHKLSRAQSYLLDQLDLGGWNCFRE